LICARQPLGSRRAAKTVPAAPLQFLRLRTTAIYEPDARDRIDTFIAYLGGARSEGMIQVRHAVLTASSPNGEGKTDAADQAAGAVMENIHTAALLEPGASLRFLEAGSGDMADSQARIASASRDIHFRKLTARLDRGSRLQAVSAHPGSRFTRNGFSIDLAGEGAEGEVNG